MKNQRIQRNVILSSVNEENEFLFEGGKDVQEVLDNITKTLKTFAPRDMDKATGELNLLQLDIKEKFDRLMMNVKESKLTESEKLFITTESTFIANDIRKGSSLSSSTSKVPLPNSISKTSIYAEKNSPVAVIYGTGPVGLKMKEIAEFLGKTSNIRLIEADYLGSIRDSELSQKLRDINTVIIAADATPEESKSWFGMSSLPERKYCIDSTALKKTLNILMKDQERRNIEEPLKIVWYGSAVQASKSVASYLTGEASSMDSEFILQCTQRNMRYMSVLTGNIIQDDAVIPSNGKVRSAYHNLFEQSPIPSSHGVLLTLSKSVESSEYTRVSTACQALYRAATHPNGNTTVTVLSTSHNQPPSDSDWDNEFLKVDGPELMRVKIDHATMKQASARLGRLLPQLSLPDSGLVTPINITMHSNGIKIIFVPISRNYESSKDLKKKEMAQKLLTNEQVTKSKYIPPERDIDALKPLDQPVPMKASILRKPEGGVEILFEESFNRIRIRRCNMGPGTIVKEESEALILKYITSSLRALETDCKLMKKQLSNA